MQPKIILTTICRKIELKGAQTSEKSPIGKLNSSIDIRNYIKKNQAFGTNRPEYPTN